MDTSPHHLNIQDLLSPKDWPYELNSYWLGSTLIVAVAAVCLWELFVYLRAIRREKKFDTKLQERIAARMNYVYVDNHKDYSFEDTTTDDDSTVTLTLINTWENADLSASEQDHMRERSAHHAREWLTREIETGDIHPVAQSHMYNLLYSLRNAETQLSALRETTRLAEESKHRLGDNRKKPRVKLIIEKESNK